MLFTDFHMWQWVLQKHWADTGLTNTVILQVPPRAARFFFVVLGVVALHLHCLSPHFTGRSTIMKGPCTMALPSTDAPSPGTP